MLFFRALAGCLSGNVAVVKASLGEITVRPDEHALERALLETDADSLTTPLHPPPPGRDEPGSRCAQSFLASPPLIARDLTDTRPGCSFPPLRPHLDHRCVTPRQICVVRAAALTSSSDLRDPRHDPRQRARRLRLASGRELPQLVRRVGVPHQVPVLPPLRRFRSALGVWRESSRHPRHLLFLQLTIAAVSRSGSSPSSSWKSRLSRAARPAAHPSAPTTTKTPRRSSSSTRPPRLPRSTRPARATYRFAPTAGTPRASGTPPASRARRREAGPLTRRQTSGRPDDCCACPWSRGAVASCRSRRRPTNADPDRLPLLPPAGW